MESAGLKISECTVDCQEEVIPMYDGLTIPLDNEVDSDIVSETVVVTTSPDDRSAEGIKEIPQLGLNIDESVTDSAGQTQSEVVDTPDVESQGYTSHVSVDCVDVATTLQQLSSSGGLWTASGVFEDFTRLRDRLKKREQRKNPEYRRRESAKARVRMANRRNDPVLREIERRKDRERRALARQKAGVREKERKRDKVYKKLLRDKAKHVYEIEGDSLFSISDNTNTVIVNSGASCVKTRIESLTVINEAQVTPSCDSVCDIGSIMKDNENHSRGGSNDFSGTVIVSSEKSYSSQVLTNSNKSSGSHSTRGCKTNTSDTMFTCNHGDGRTSNHGDIGETVRIISDSDEEVVLCAGDAIDEKTTMFIKNIVLKTSTM